MEDKQYLDEAGLGEVGQVISKFYASKDDVKNIDVTKQLDDYAKKTDLDNKVDKIDGKILSTNDFTNDDKKIVEQWKGNNDWAEFMEHYNKSLSVFLDSALLQAVLPITHLCLNTSELYVNHLDNGDEWIFKDSVISKSMSDPYKYELLTKEELSLLGTGVLTVEKQTPNSNSLTPNGVPCYIVQNWIALSNGLYLSRRTKETKVEYSDNYLLKQWKKQKENFDFYSVVPDDGWSDWIVADDSFAPLSISPVSPNEPQAGLMLPEDKKKLDSINVDDITSSIKSNQIVNDLTTGGTNKVLSAEQGKVLFQYANEGKERIANALIGKGVENVSKDSSFYDLARGIYEAKTGYGVGDVIKFDDLEVYESENVAEEIISKSYVRQQNSFPVIFPTPNSPDQESFYSVEQYDDHAELSKTNFQTLRVEKVVDLPVSKQSEGSTPEIFAHGDYITIYYKLCLFVYDKRTKTIQQQIDIPQICDIPSANINIDFSLEGDVFVSSSSFDTFGRHDECFIIRDCLTSNPQVTSVTKVLENRSIDIGAISSAWVQDQILHIIYTPRIQYGKLRHVRFNITKGYVVDDKQLLFSASTVGGWTSNIYWENFAPYILNQFDENGSSTKLLHDNTPVSRVVASQNQWIVIETRGDGDARRPWYIINLQNHTHVEFPAPNLLNDNTTMLSNDMLASTVWDEKSVKVVVYKITLKIKSYKVLK